MKTALILLSVLLISGAVIGFVVAADNYILSRGIITTLRAPDHPDVFQGRLIPPYAPQTPGFGLAAESFLEANRLWLLGAAALAVLAGGLMRRREYV